MGFKSVEDLVKIRELIENDTEITIPNPYPDDLKDFDYYNCITGYFECEYFMLILTKYDNDFCFEIREHVSDDAENIQNKLYELTNIKFTIT